MEILIPVVVYAIVIAVVIYSIHKGKKARPSRTQIAELAASQQSHLQEFLDRIYEDQKLPEIQATINLKKGEIAHLHDNSVVLMEERSVSVSNRGGGAVRIAKGLYLGGSQAVSRSHDELRQIDQGELTFTNKRIVFVGATKTKQFDLNKIIQMEVFSDGLSISYEGREKKTIFRTQSLPLIWDMMFQVQKRIDTGNPIERITISVRPE